MSSFWNDIKDYIAIPLTVLIVAFIYAVTKWALKQKAVTSHQYLETVLSIVNETALAIATSLNKIPAGQAASFNLIANDVVNTAVNSIMANFNPQVTKAGLSKLALHDMLSAKVVQNGAGTAIPLETRVKYKLPSHAILNIKEEKVLQDTVCKDIQKTFKDDVAMYGVDVKTKKATG